MFAQGLIGCALYSKDRNDHNAHRLQFWGQFLRLIKVRLGGGDWGLTKGTMGREGQMPSYQVFQTMNLQIISVSLYYPMPAYIVAVPRISPCLYITFLINMLYI